MEENINTTEIAEAEVLETTINESEAQKEERLALETDKQPEAKTEAPVVNTGFNFNFVENGVTTTVNIPEHEFSLITVANLHKFLCSIGVNASITSRPV